MTKFILLMSLMSSAAIAESVDSGERQDVYKSMIGCASYYATLESYPPLSISTRQENEAKSRNFLSAANVFHADQSVAGASADFEELRTQMGKSVLSEKKSDLESMLGDIAVHCAGMEETANTALANKPSAASK
jgi:hypothetical protein